MLPSFQDLPPIADLKISIGDDVTLAPVGDIMSIVGVLGNALLFFRNALH
jgi:hypothetical protein